MKMRLHASNVLCSAPRAPPVARGALKCVAKGIEVSLHGIRDKVSRARRIVGTRRDAYALVDNFGWRNFAPNSRRRYGHSFQAKDEESPVRVPVPLSLSTQSSSMPFSRSAVVDIHAVAASFATFDPPLFPNFMPNLTRAAKRRHIWVALVDVVLRRPQVSSWLPMRCRRMLNGCCGRRVRLMEKLGE